METVITDNASEKITFYQNELTFALISEDKLQHTDNKVIILNFDELIKLIGIIKETLCK